MEDLGRGLLIEFLKMCSLVNLHEADINALVKVCWVVWSTIVFSHDMLLISDYRNAELCPVTRDGDCQCQR